MKNILEKTEVRLIQFFSYVGILIYLILKGHGLMSVVFAHLIFMVVCGVIYLRQDFLLLFLSPLLVIIIPIQNSQIKKYLKRFKQNTPSEAVIILGQSDYFKFEGWIKANFVKDEIESLVKYLETKGQEFSFYPNANIEEVEEIMSNKDIREVYFFGHGNSHMFQLSADNIIYYCEFNDFKKYRKEYVHQVHCGSSHGKSLVDYVVPEKNRDKCFLFRKTINSFDIKNEFKRRLNNIKKINKNKHDK
ncbi:MAG: hypothetical protein WCX73_05095 [Candidatus Pacearchaeota archaeon]|jgi:hypothetical protein